jgi:hypothetical protein
LDYRRQGQQGQTFSWWEISVATGSNNVSSLSLTGVTYLNLKPTQKSTFYLFVCVPGEGASRREMTRRRSQSDIK